MGKSAISQRGNVGDQLSDPWCAKGGGKLEIGSLEGKVDICLGADGWVLKKHVTVFEDVGICGSLGRFFLTSMIWTQNDGFVQEYMINIICTAGSLDILPSKTMTKCQSDTSTNATVSISCWQIASSKQAGHPSMHLYEPFAALLDFQTNKKSTNLPLFT